MKRRLLALLFCCLSSMLQAESGLKILLVVGSGGTETYSKEFAEIATLWEDAADAGDAAIEVIGLDRLDDNSPSDADRLQQALAAETSPELWLVLIGHGTYDHREVKFNLRGRDVTDAELARWCDAYRGSLAVVNCASASGSFIRELSHENRVVITATKNEGELSYTRFGRYFIEAIRNTSEGDLDNDGQVSLLEAFLAASAQVAKFYKDEGRIATEHALLDDNGDQLGSRSEWFEGATATQNAAPEASPDGDLARQKVLIKNEFERRLSPAQREKRDSLEREVIALRRSKAELDEESYYSKLEPLLLELAHLYDSVASLEN